MTENMKKFVEAISGDKEFVEKLTQAKDAAAVIALAKEKGFILTEEDLQPASGIQEISDDEVEAVVGGKACYCVLGGGGEESKNKGERTCACFAYGEGLYDNGNYRCGCAAYGQGD